METDNTRKAELDLEIKLTSSKLTRDEAHELLYKYMCDISVKSHIAFYELIESFYPDHIKRSETLQ